MNVLLVNCFSKNNSQGQTLFGEFEKHIKTIFQKVSSQNGIDSVEYFLRDYSNLDDFLFEENSDYENLSCLKFFEKLDFIFIDGCENSLPWKKNGFKLVLLMKMCKKYQKNLFCCSIGFQILVYFLSTNYLININIINSDSNIKTIEEIHLIEPKFLKNLKKFEYFLDYVSGDLYEYDMLENSWQPLTNTGLHNSKQIDKYKSRGKLVSNKNIIKIKDPFSEIGHNTSSEFKIQVCKQYLSHWLLKDIKREYFAKSTSTWYPHNICMNNLNLQFRVLCDSNNGPTVIEHHNSIAVNFHITKKYDQTVKLLENYIHYKFHLINDKGIVYSKIELTDPNAEFQEEGKNKGIAMSKELLILQKISQAKPSESLKLGGIRPSSSNLVNNSRPFSKIKKTEKIANHVGFNFSKRDMIFVDNNSVNTRPFCPKLNLTNEINEDELKKKNSGFEGKTDNSYTSNDKKFTIESLKKRSDDLFNQPESKSKYNSKDVNSHHEKSLIDFYKKERNKITSELNEIDLKNVMTQNKISRTTMSPKSTKSPHSRISSSQEKFNSSHKKIEDTVENEKDKKEENLFMMLFPYTKESAFPLTKKTHIIGSGFNIDKNKVVEKVNLFKTFYSNFNEKYRKYEKDLNTFRDVCSVRCSSQYQSDTKRWNQECLEKKKKWIVENDFQRFFGIGTKTMEKLEIKNLGANDPYVSPSSHKFRPVDKNRWLKK